MIGTCIDPIDSCTSQCAYRQRWQKEQLLSDMSDHRSDHLCTTPELDSQDFIEQRVMLSFPG